MKIDPLASQPSSSLRRKQRGETAGSGDFAEALEGEASSVASVAGTANLGKVDALLALQEVPDSLTGDAQAKTRGEDLLDELEQLRLGFLAGTLQRAQLVRLNRLLAGRREQIHDPRLAAIIAEIELRAAVELAKLEC
jgi:hypothetical protein